LSRFESESGDRGLQLTGILWYKEDARYILLYTGSLSGIQMSMFEEETVFLFGEGIELVITIVKERRFVMYFKITNQLKRLCLISFVIIMTLGIFAALEHDMAYADGGHKTTLNVVGVPEDVSVQWYYLTVDENSDEYYIWSNPYTIPTPLDLILTEDGDRECWTIETSKLKECGPLTGVLLTDNEGNELQFIKAADKDKGIQTTDFPDKPYNSSYSGIYCLTAHPEKEYSYGVEDAYILENMLADVTTKNPTYDGAHSTIVACSTVNDTVDHIITLYFNGAEDGPAVPEEVQAVIDAIGAIDDPVTLDSEEKITAARAAFEALSEEDQALIDAETLKKLTDAEETLANLKAISNVVSMIDAIDNPVTLDSEEKINAAQTAYDNLKDEQKAQVTNYGDLLKAQLAIANLKLAKAEKDLEDAKKEADGKVAEAEGKAKDAEAKLAEAEKKLKEAKKIGKVQLKTIKGAKKKITVTWKKKTGVKGYEIIVAKNKAGTKDALTYSVKGNKAKKVIKKLKKGKYFVKVRAYKTFNGNTLFGTWSTAKKVKVK